MRTLEIEEIREVDEILKERHPLYYNNSQIHDIFPSLKVILQKLLLYYKI